MTSIPIKTDNKRLLLSNKKQKPKNIIASYLWPRSKCWMRAHKRAFNTPRLKSQIGCYGVFRFCLLQQALLVMPVSVCYRKPPFVSKSFSIPISTFPLLSSPTPLHNLSLLPRFSEGPVCQEFSQTAGLPSQAVP